MSKDNCENCPVTQGACLARVDPHGFGHYCGWAKSGTDLQRKIIVNRSAIGAPAMPSLAQQGVNFATAVAAHVATGGRGVTPGELAERLAICGGCEFFQGGRCSKCGCGLWMKANWAEQSCPLDPPKWGPILDK